MSTGFLLNLSLALHLMGLSVSIGVALTKYLSFRKASSGTAFDLTKWTMTLGASRRLTMYMGIGMGVAILSGALMMHLAYAAFMQQLWFQLKIVSIALIIVAGIIVNRNESKLKKQLKAEGQIQEKYRKLAGRLVIFSGVQFALFMVIIILASFRFI